MIASPLVYWTVVGLAVGVYLGVNVYFLYRIEPRRKPIFRSVPRALVAHWLPQAAFLVSLVLLLQMIVAPLLLMSTVLIFLLLANNKKFEQLNEPLLPADIALTLRQLHVWRLLVQYVRRDRSVLIVLPAAIVTTLVVLVCEPWAFGRYYFLLALLSPVPVAIVFWPPRGRSLLIRQFKAHRVSFLDWDITASVAAGGFIPTFIRCLDSIPRSAFPSINATVAKTVLAEKFGKNGVPCSPSGQKPNIVVVLAEAFADPRTMGIPVEPNPLTNYDDAVQCSVYSGQSWVPVYGGWTIRSEYSLLTGISSSTFANNIGNPNTTLVCPATHSLPKHLKKHGYRTAMVHPHDRRFYGRGNVCGSLGFDEFLDEQAFADAPREGRYISDLAVASRIEQELHQATSPTFLFCITMENHGPWNIEPLPETMEEFTTQPRLNPTDHLLYARYLRHLRNADRMIRRLADMVAAATTPTIVLLVGDHIPGLTDLFREAGSPIFMTPGEPWSPTAPYLQTPYFLLSNMPAERREMNCDISFLSGLVLDCAGLNSDSFFHHNSAMRRHLNGNIHSDADPAARQAYLRFCYDVATFPDRYVATP